MLVNMDLAMDLLCNLVEARTLALLTVRLDFGTGTLGQGQQRRVSVCLFDIFENCQLNLSYQLDTANAKVDYSRFQGDTYALVAAGEGKGTR